MPPTLQLRDRFLTPDRPVAEYRSALAQPHPLPEVRMAPMEIRDVSGLTVVFRAIVFDSPSVDMGGWKEVIKRGATRPALAGNPDIRLLLNHDGVPFGRTTAGTLRLSEQPEGVDSVAEFPDTQAARDLIVSIERGDINQCSFAFTVAVNGTEWIYNEDEGIDYRYVHRMARIYEESIVTFPAYEDTFAAVKRAQGDPQQADDADRDSTASADAAEGRDTDQSTPSPVAGVDADEVFAARRRRIQQRAIDARG